jgi:hypothetical protein
MSGQAPYHRIQRADADALIGIMVEPDVEQLDEIIVNPWRMIAVRCVRWAASTPAGRGTIRLYFDGAHGKGKQNE